MTGGIRCLPTVVTPNRKVDLIIPIWDLDEVVVFLQVAALGGHTIYILASSAISTVQEQEVRLIPFTIKTLSDLIHRLCPQPRCRRDFLA